MIDRRLQYVVSTARYGSFTAAAERVGVTQSAITKSVADLERQLGFAIFNRTARGVLLTEQGQNFVARAARLLEETGELMGSASVGADPYSGVLRIGVCPASLEWLLVEPLTTLVARHPSIQLEIIGSSYDKSVQQLRTGATDVVVGYEAAFLEQPDFRLDRMASLLTTFFVRQGHPITECETVTREEIARYDIISPSESSPISTLWRHIFDGLPEPATGRVHIIDYFPIVERLVRNTNAISVASTSYSHTSLFKRHFVAVPFPALLQPSSLCCATRLRWSPRPAVRAFMKACRERLPTPEAPLQAA